MQVLLRHVRTASGSESESGNNNNCSRRTLSGRGGRGRRRRRLRGRILPVPSVFHIFVVGDTSTLATSTSRLGSGRIRRIRRPRRIRCVRRPRTGRARRVRATTAISLFRRCCRLRVFVVDNVTWDGIRGTLVTVVPDAIVQLACYISAVQGKQTARV